MRSNIYDPLPMYNLARATIQMSNTRHSREFGLHESVTNRPDSGVTEIDDSPPPPPPPPPHLLSKRPSWWSLMSLDNWVWELGAAILCLCVLASIGGILIAYNNRSVPDLPESLSINAIISFLASLGKASLMVVLAAAIRQEKWLWFIDKPRPLSMVDSFEEASRGPYGSLHLILTWRGRVVLPFHPPPSTTISFQPH